MDLMRQDTARHYKAIHGLILKGNMPLQEAGPKDRALLWVLIAAGVLVFVALFASCAHAYSDQQLAVAIYHAENSKNHPYGIMMKYRHTSPRQACLNTIHHYYRVWANLPYKDGLKPAFLTFLSKHYAPIGAKNDPKGLNRNWKRNVLSFLKEAK